MSWWIAASIFVSAGTYLFDFVSNLVVLSEYAQPYVRFQRLKRQRRCDYHCTNLASEVSVYFWAMIVFLLLAHTLNALIFRFKFRKEDGPLKAAYFLPLIHLWRLISLLWRTLSCHGVESLRCPYMNGLFGILGSAVEGLPLLTFQFVGYIVLSRDDVLPQMNTIFKVSVAASLISAAYNGGAAVQSIAENAKVFSASLQVAACSALFTVFAGLSRCLTYINIIVRIGDYFDRDRPPQSKAKFYSSDIIIFVFVAACVTAFWLYYWIFHQPRSLIKSTKRCLTCLVFAYMSMTVGPLYPMVSEARDSGELGTFKFEAKLLVVGTVSISIDMIILWTTFVLGTQPRVYLIVSLMSAFGYLASVAWYLRIDKLCGLVKDTEQGEQGEDLDSSREVAEAENGGVAMVDEDENSAIFDSFDVSVEIE